MKWNRYIARPMPGATGYRSWAVYDSQRESWVANGQKSTAITLVPESLAKKMADERNEEKR